MQGNNTVCGYLDVKISAKSRRGLTPWKAWQKQWCELKRLDSIDKGVELKLKSSNEGSVLNCLLLPRSATICRTESRTKKFAFGVFTLGRTQKPILFLSGTSESDAQEWISTIRKMLCIATYLPVGHTNFHVSIVDNAHSRAAGVVGLHGVLGTNSQDIVISDPCTGDTLIHWQWYFFHQFHFQATTQPVDDKRILVMHASGEFPGGPGQIHLYCEQGPRLLNHLVARGKRSKPRNGLRSSKRLSRSEGDLCGSCSSDSPLCIRSQAGSDDSGVRVSISSDDSGYLLKPKTASSLVSIGMAVLTKTPGGSETNDDSLQDLTLIEEETTNKGLPRRESGISLCSGIYEEIPEDSPSPKSSLKPNHIYENPLDVILDIGIKLGKHCKPPPLPPRQLDFRNDKGPYKPRSNTLPASDLSRISQIFTSDSDYVVMSPSKACKDKSKICTIAESLYMPMAPVINLKNKIENCYIIMNGGGKK